MSGKKCIHVSKKSVFMSGNFASVFLPPKTVRPGPPLEMPSSLTTTWVSIYTLEPGSSEQHVLAPPRFTESFGDDAPSLASIPRFHRRQFWKHINHVLANWADGSTSLCTISLQRKLPPRPQAQDVPQELANSAVLTVLGWPCSDTPHNDLAVSPDITSLLKPITVHVTLTVAMPMTLSSC